MMASRLMIRKGSSSSLVQRTRSPKWSSLDSASRSLSAVVTPSLKEEEATDAQCNIDVSQQERRYPALRKFNAQIRQVADTIGGGMSSTDVRLGSSIGDSRRLYSTFSSSSTIPPSPLHHQPSLHSYHHTSSPVEKLLTPSWKRLLYTSSARALSSSSSDIDPRLAQALHRVVRRACFSTDTAPKEQKKKELSKSKTAPGESAASSSSSTPSKQEKEKKPMAQQVQDAITSATKAIVSFLFKIPGWTFFYLTHPTELRKALNNLYEAAKHEAHHYWMGTKLLYADVQTAGKLFNRTLQGSSLTRRERKQLLRTVSDLFRLVPFSMFILIPFMEFVLPFALRLFPNMLPSTFQDSLKAEENMKRELQSRIAMAQFFQETLQGMAKEQKKKSKKRLENADESSKEERALQEERSAGAMLDFMGKARNGEILPADVIIQFASHFHDDLTLDNMPRMQLINMCRYMNIPPYGSDFFLRFQLRHKIRTLVEDDQRILWEGIDSLTKMELREACQERGMRSTGLSKDAYKNSLQQWLDLSVNKHVPISLLVMSRSFFLREEMTTTGASSSDNALAGLADAISGLDQDIVNEVVLEVATSEEKYSDPEIRKIKLEVLEAQNERILEEQKEREAANKKKEKQEKQELEKQELEKLELEKKEQQADELAVGGTTPSTMTPAEEEVFAATSEKSEEAKEDEEDILSTQELDALEQLIDPDPVNKEREELERIKAAMHSAESEEERQELELIKATMMSERTEEVAISWGDGEKVYTPKAMERTTENMKIEADPAAVTPEEADKMAKKFITKLDIDSAAEAESSTKMVHEGSEESTETDDVEEAKSGDQYFDRTIESLKARVERMVGKIETQLDSVEEKIGDKLHFLDKDGDGILTLDEMSDALQRVLKRSLSKEEALAIAELMDENKDGVFTIDEFTRWIETNRLVQLVKEGKDGDLDRLLEKHSDEENESKEPSISSSSS